MWKVTSENILVKTRNRKLVICKIGLPKAKKKGVGSHLEVLKGYSVF